MKASSAFLRKEAVRGGGSAMFSRVETNKANLSKKVLDCQAINRIVTNLSIKSDDFHPSSYRQFMTNCGKMLTI